MTPAEEAKYLEMALGPKDSWTQADISLWNVLNQKYFGHWRSTHVRMGAKGEDSMMVHISEVPLWRSRGFHVLKQKGEKA